MGRTKLPELLEDSEDGFADLSLRVVSRARAADGRMALTAKASFDGSPVGLEIVLGPDWKAASVGDFPVLWGEVAYRSIGEESDRFLAALAAYACRGGGAMKEEVKFTAVALEGDPRADPPQAVRMKLFYESGGEKQYAEVYTNVDVTQGRVEIREKDAEYRRPLLAALTAPEARADRATRASAAPASDAPDSGKVRLPAVPIDSKLANLRRRAAKEDVEVEHLVGFAVRGDPRAVPGIRELQAKYKWPHSHLVDGRHVVPLGRWADLVCLYLEGGCDALLAYARRDEPDSFPFAVHVLGELKSAPAAAALAELAGEVAVALPGRIADAKTLTDAINGADAPAIDPATKAKLRSFLHGLLNHDMEIVWRMAAVYALRGIGDQESIRLIAALPTPPAEPSDKAKVIKIIRKRL